MSALEDIRALADASHLEVLGALHIPDEDRDLAGDGTLVILGPREPGFWAHVTDSPEFGDRDPDPLDRWSARVISGIAAELQGKALFPFSDAPYLPFYRWATDSGSLWTSPVRLLVHASQGLLVSIRGAVAVPETLDLAAPVTQPCLDCRTKPCLSACPVGALTVDHYLVDACHSFLNTDPGQRCRDGGCNVRVSCPVSRTYARLPEQSAYHMRQFHK